VTPDLDLFDIQGNILRGYRLDLVRHILLEVSDRAAARRFLAAAASDAPAGGADVPRITRASDWQARIGTRFNIGLTFEGLRALGTAPSDLATFPTDFAEGMAARAEKLSDVGDSAPANWPAPFDRPDRLHIVATVYAGTTAGLDGVEAQLARAFTVLGVRDGHNRSEGRVFFGYVDGISQPRFRDVADPDMRGVDEPMDPLGTVLLGHPTHFEGLAFRVPSPDVLGRNGAFNAFRVLRQDVVGFEAFLDRAADHLVGHAKVDLLLPPGAERQVGEGLDRRGALREVVAAQMCGRWRNGTPYTLSPDAQLPEGAVSRTNYDYGRTSRCPVGAHMRRVNPRGGQIVQRVANRTRRLVRRGVPYGPDFDPAKPDTHERGLLGNFIGASIGGQFEAVMCDWLNLGLQDPDITGTNDPLLGANDPATSWFDLTLSDGGSIRLTGLPRLVTTRGGAYTFLPSLSAIRHLAGLTG
jgi:deferrochelatase/peroxidase EfeB